MKFATNIAIALTTLTLVNAEEAPLDLVDTLNQDNLQESFRILLDDYIQPTQLSALEINRAALDGLLDRLGLGAELVERNGDDSSKEETFSTYHEILPGNTAYLRPAGFSGGELEKTDAALASFIEAKCQTLVLDLRVPMPNERFGEATRFLDRFCPPNTVLFKISKPGSSKPQLFTSKPAANSWPGETILLIDSDTGGAAEMVAAVIHHQRESVIVGQQTPGTTVQYQTVNVSEKAAIRFAVAEAALPDDSSLFQKGLNPTIKSLTKRDDKLAVFAASEKEGVAKFINDKERPVLNEAALVAGTNPELPYHLDKTAKRESEFDQIPLQDIALQRIVDFLKVRAFLEQE